MAGPYANVAPPSLTNGILYASAVPLTSTEADLYSPAATPPADGQDPIQVTYGQAIQAIVQLTPQGGLVAANSYVVMQTDLGDGVWVDVAWAVWNANTAATFILSGGSAGANAFRQTRQANSFPTPQAVGSNQIPLGGRVRFVGKSILTGGSSISAGSAAGFLCTIRYKLLPLR